MKVLIFSALGFCFVSSVFAAGPIKSEKEKPAYESTATYNLRSFETGTAKSLKPMMKKIGERSRELHETLQSLKKSDDSKALKKQIDDFHIRLRGIRARLDEAKAKSFRSNVDMAALRKQLRLLESDVKSLNLLY